MGEEVYEGLSPAEMSELLIGYAQENERLEAQVENLTRKCAGLERTAAARLEYIRDVRATEAAVRRFVKDPAIAPYIPSIQAVKEMLFGPVILRDEQ